MNDDLISRQAAIDAIGKKSDEIYKTKQKGATYPHDDFFQGMAYAESVLKAIPSADIDLSGFSDKLWKIAYERGKAEAWRWIPVSEQLPEDGQEVLFSTKTGRVHQGKYHNDNSVNQWYSSLDKMRAWNNVVNAWMPLPEPYEERYED